MKTKMRLRVSGYIERTSPGRSHDDKGDWDCRCCKVLGEDVVGDEFHVLCKCPALKKQRDAFFQQLDGIYGDAGLSQPPRDNADEGGGMFRLFLALLSDGDCGLVPRMRHVWARASAAFDRYLASIQLWV